MRWPVLFLVLSLATVGCKQRCLFDEASQANQTVTAALNLPEESPTVTALPLTNARDLPAPSTIDRPTGQPRYLSLQEAIALALEHGTVGIESAQSPGQAREGLIGFGGRGVFGSDSIRVLALDPARTATEIEAALSRFDARCITSMNWVTTDTPVGSPLDIATGGGTLDAIQTQAATLNTAIVKPLATGGLVSAGFRTDYEFTNLSSPVNPSYRPQMRFQFEQPLLQGFGVEINQIRSTHPGSLLSSFTGATPTEGILIVRTRFDQSRAEFGRNLNTQLWNVEAAYWNLFGAYWRLCSRELGLRQAHEVWRREEGLTQAGRSSRANSAQARGQYESFRSQRLAAVGAVLEAERQLRLLVGLPREDGTRLIPASTPTLTPYQPDWHRSLEEALAERPELLLARSEVKVKQLELIGERNRLLPDLRLTSNYDIQGLGSRLDGPGEANALKSLASNRFHNWGIGLRLEVPIGYREAHSRVRASQIELTRSLEVLKDQENKVASFLAYQYRQLAELHAQIRTARARRETFAEQLDVRFREFIDGRDVPLPFLLEAQRSWSDALASEYEFIVAYNNALAGFEFAKGTIARYHNVSVAEGAAPACVQRRAVENEKERTQALVLRERAIPTQPNAGPVPQLPSGEAQSLPALLQGIGAAEAGLVR